MNNWLCFGTAGEFDMWIKSNLSGVGKRRRILLVDQFPITRMAVSEWLKQTPDLSVCGEADNPTSAFTAVSHLKPDMVVTEIINQQDLGFIQLLHQRYPQLPILVFSFRDEEWYAPRALEAGADGYLMKGASRDRLVEGIRSALEGRVVLSPEMRARLLLKCQTGRRLTTPSAKPRRRLCSTKAA